MIRTTTLPGCPDGSTRDRTPGRRTAPCAFTLVELLVTVVLLLLLAGIGIWYYGPVRAARLEATAREEVRRVRDAIEAWRLVEARGGAFPGSFAEVPALSGLDWIDPWGVPYGLDKTDHAVYSAGPDRVAFTPDDLRSPLSLPREPAPAGANPAATSPASPSFAVWQHDQTGTQLDALAAALSTWRRDHLGESIPERLDSFAPVASLVVVDPWGAPYRYDLLADEVRSAGPDAEPGTLDDLAARLESP